MEGDSFSQYHEENFADMYDRPYYGKKEVSYINYFRDDDKVNSTTSTHRQPFDKLRSEQGTFDDKYAPKPYQKNYISYPRTRDSTSSSVKKYTNLDPMERYKMFKQSNKNNPYKKRNRAFHSNQMDPSKEEYHGGVMDSIYGNKNKEYSNGPIFEDERTTKLNYRNVLPKPRNFQAIDSRDRDHDFEKEQFDSNETKNNLKENESYGYVKN